MLRAQIEIQAQDAAKVLYQHTVLCQTVMPYRDPGPDARLWHRVQGNAHLEIQAGRALHPEKREFVDVGLPFGPKPRLVLYYLNAEALRTRSPLIEVQDSLTSFVKRIGLAPKGQNMTIVKDSSGCRRREHGARRRPARRRRDWWRCRSAAGRGRSGSG